MRIAPKVVEPAVLVAVLERLADLVTSSTRVVVVFVVVVHIFSGFEKPVTPPTKVVYVPLRSIRVRTTGGPGRERLIACCSGRVSSQGGHHLLDFQHGRRTLAEPVRGVEMRHQVRLVTVREIAIAADVVAIPLVAVPVRRRRRRPSRGR